jgi:hypothetical protein
LREWCPGRTSKRGPETIVTYGTYTGRELRVEVTYVLSGGDGSPFGVPDGYAVLGLAIPLARAAEAIKAARSDLEMVSALTLKLARTLPRMPDAPGTYRSGGVAAVAAERERQVTQEGHTDEHDDAHDGGELAHAAAALAVACIDKGTGWGFWPWDDASWKPRDRRSNLVRAGALIAAEIDRLDRAAQAGPDAPG